MDKELLQVDPSFQWASLLLFLITTTVLMWISRALILSRKLFPNASRLDWLLSVLVLLFFIVGMGAWSLHPFFPSRPWQWLVLRDLAQRLGPYLGFLAMIVFALLRLGFDPLRRWEFISRSSRLSCKAWVFIPLVLGVVGWNSWKGGLDVADLFSTPITTRDLAVGYRRAYRSRPADVIFAKSGSMIVPHGMRLPGLKRKEYEIELTPHGKILLSCRE